MKKTRKLEIKKVTLRDLDEPTMQGMAGGIVSLIGTCQTCKTCYTDCGTTCSVAKCNCGT
ncbi:MAG: hypothetical protein WCA49_05205 [Candidatus Sulfotelmatobacter sp.]